MMNLFIYSDESGVFDNVHEDIFVYGGLVFLSSKEKEIASRMYSGIEKQIRQHLGKESPTEIKATTVKTKHKKRLFSSMNRFIRFGVVINQKQILEEIYQNKKTKQRYLDYAFKIGVKHAFEVLIKQGRINPNEVESLYFRQDEHSMATNGKYELKEALEQEFRFGTYNFKWDKYFQPIFPSVKTVDLELCNSEKNLLVRAADIVANKLYCDIRDNREHCSDKCIIVKYLP